VFAAKAEDELAAQRIRGHRRDECRARHGQTVVEHLGQPGNTDAQWS
jgi:hypothetical protein